LPIDRTRRVLVALAVAIVLGGLCLQRPTVAQTRTQPIRQTCIDFSTDPAGCQPSTFDTPLEQMPSVRVNGRGEVDPFSSEKAARAGAALLEEKLHLFRNFEHLHWVITVPSVKDPGTGAWRDGDLDGAGDARGLAIAGSCIYVGHQNGPG